MKSFLPLIRAEWRLLLFGFVMTFGSSLGQTYFISVLVLRHLGQGLMGMAGATAMVRYIDHQKGKANGLSGIGYSLSEAILPSLVIASLAVMSWRQSWVLWAVLLGITIPLATRFLLRGHKFRHAAYLEKVSVQ